jgi:hypothetical protein
MKTLILILALSILTGASTAFAQREVDSSIELSPEGRYAFGVLMSAKRFEDTHVGYGGELSELVVAYRQIMKEPKRVSVLKFLLENASKPGQLYALAGLFDADHDYFRSAVTAFKDDESEVNTLSGCVGGLRKVSEIVFFDDPRTIRLESPRQSFNEWSKKTNVMAGFNIDISGGGYSVMFRERGLN